MSRILENVMQSMAALEKYGSLGKAAEALGVAKSTLQMRVAKGKEWQAEGRGFELPQVQSDEPTYEEIKNRAIEDFTRLHANREAIKLLKIKVNVEGPFGLMVTGDPHIDNPGCNIPLLYRHIEIAKQTEGMFVANVGDITDNWVGRLARLYSSSNMSRSRALILVEGFLREVPWLWIDPGNHDLWSGADDPLRWLTKQAGILYKWQGSRIELVPPHGHSVTVNSRHDHPGYSMYHATHGALKAAIWDGYHDDIYTSGHIHSGGYMLYPHNHGKVSHILRVSSYKQYDAHKDEKGFRDRTLPCGVFIIDPLATTELGRIVFYADPEEGALALKLKRDRWGFKSSMAAAKMGLKT